MNKHLARVTSNTIVHKLKGAWKASLILLLHITLTGCTTLPEATNESKSQSINVKRSISASDLKIEKLVAEAVSDTQLKFTLHYKTDKERFLSFFQPPSGKKLMILKQNALKLSESQYSFLVDKNAVKDLNFITMRFSTPKNPEADRNFIFLNIEQVKGLLL